MAFQMDFTGKVIIVTGASSGIGAATAKLFAGHGAHLTIVGRNEHRLHEVAKRCKESSGHEPLCVLVDLTAEGSCEEVVTKTVQRHAKIDVLINCAGKAGMTSLFDNTMTTFDELVALNLRVPYKMTQLCIPHLKETRGNVVNVVGTPLRVRPGLLPVAMIRDAMETFTKNGALELTSVGVRMNAVRPGITRTNILTNFNIDSDNLNEAYEHLSHIVPNRVIIEPEEIAKMIVFTASDNCPNLNAASIIVDNGANLN